MLIVPILNVTPINVTDSKHFLICNPHFLSHCCSLTKSPEGGGKRLQYGLLSETMQEKEGGGVRETQTSERSPVCVQASE